MTAVVGFLVVAAIAIGAALLVASPHHVVQRDPTFELEDVSARQVPILGVTVLTGFLLLSVFGAA